MRTRCRPMLGTFVEITVPADAAAAMEAGFRAIGRVQRLMSFHDEASDLGRLRRAAPGATVEVAPETAEVLQLALDLHRDSGGLFDVTVAGELVRTGFLPRPRSPSRKARPIGNASDIAMAGPRHVRCLQPSLIDLGGIAKGYAVDQAVEAIRAAGVTRGLVNAGGDLRMFGGAPWPIALRDADGELRETLWLADCAVASSANLRNRRRRWGRLRTPHIGFGRRPMASTRRTTVVASSCVIADAMTKIAMADRALAERLLARHAGYLIGQACAGVAA